MRLNDGSDLTVCCPMIAKIRNCFAGEGRFIPLVLLPGVVKVELIIRSQIVQQVASELLHSHR